MMQLSRVHMKHIGIYQHFSTAAGTGGLRRIGVGQGGRLSVRLPRATAILRVTTAWSDECDITVSRVPLRMVALGDYKGEPPDMKNINIGDLADCGLKADIDESMQQISVATVGDEGGEQEAYFIQAVIPEFFSVDYLATRGSVTIRHKLKGNCHVHLDEGDINVDVVRGESTKLVTGCGRVVSKELEGNVTIAATEVNAKLVNGANVQIDATGDSSSVTVGGLYSSAARITSEGRVNVSNCHGRILVSTIGALGVVTLASVNGVAEVSTGGGDANIHVEALEKGTCSTIRSGRGDILVSMSHDVRARINLAGKIGALPSVFDGLVQADKAQGRIDFPSMAQGITVRQDIGGGKINLVGAREQSLDNFFGHDEQNAVLPSLNVSSEKGGVGLETVSWIENITRRFNSARDSPEQSQSHTH